MLIAFVCLTFVNKKAILYKDCFFQKAAGPWKLVLPNLLVMGKVSKLEAISNYKKRFSELEKKSEKESSKEINLLYKTGQKLSATLNIYSLFNTTFESLCSIIDCDELVISSFNHENNLIKCEYARDSNIEEKINVRSIPLIPLAPVGFGIQSKAIRLKKAILINDYDKNFKKVITSHELIINPGRKKAYKRAVDFKPGSVLVIPMKLKNYVIGVVQIFSKKGNAYSIKQLKFAESLAHILALAYNNALLFKKAKKEIEERKFIEQKLKQLVKEKEMMVREVHHRVKNNLYAISTLLKLQTRELHDPEAIEYLDQSSNRVKAMSLIHDKLYKSVDTTNVNFEQYVCSLIEQLFLVYGVTNNRIKMDIQIKITFLNIDAAIPCGLIINELVSNSFKHAFPDNAGGNIAIKFFLDKSKKFVLKYCDNGIGLKKGTDLKSINSLGMQLIHMLREQVKGDMIIKNDNGFNFILKFKAFPGSIC